jgi:hypothetical protein
MSTMHDEVGNSVFVVAGVVFLAGVAGGGCSRSWAAEDPAEPPAVRSTAIAAAPRLVKLPPKKAFVLVMPRSVPAKAAPGEPVERFETHELRTPNETVFLKMPPTMSEPDALIAIPFDRPGLSCGSKCMPCDPGACLPGSTIARQEPPPMDEAVEVITTEGETLCRLEPSSCLGEQVLLCNDDENCGKCGEACAAGKVCRSGRCQ